MRFIGCKTDFVLDLDSDSSIGKNTVSSPMFRGSHKNPPIVFKNIFKPFLNFFSVPTIKKLILYIPLRKLGELTKRWLCLPHKKKKKIPHNIFKGPTMLELLYSKIFFHNHTIKVITYFLLFITLHVWLWFVFYFRVSPN